MAIVYKGFTFLGCLRLRKREELDQPIYKGLIYEIGQVKWVVEIYL